MRPWSRSETGAAGSVDPFAAGWASGCRLWLRWRRASHPWRPADGGQGVLGAVAAELTRAVDDGTGDARVRMLTAGSRFAKIVALDRRLRQGVLSE